MYLCPPMKPTAFFALILLSVRICGQGLDTLRIQGNLVRLGQLKGCPCRAVASTLDSAVVVTFNVDTLCRISSKMVIRDIEPSAGTMALRAIGVDFESMLMKLNRTTCRAGTMTIGIKPYVDREMDR